MNSIKIEVDIETFTFLVERAEELELSVAEVAQAELSYSAKVHDFAKSLKDSNPEEMMSSMVGAISELKEIRPND